MCLEYINEMHTVFSQKECIFTPRKLAFMKAIQAKDYRVTFNNDGYDALAHLLQESDYSSLYVMVDDCTHEACLSDFLSALETKVHIEIIEIPSGEQHKTIPTCYQVWEAMAELGADRKSLIVNLGGGVVTDLGGFIACTFKRGIDFIQVPTSLLAMVDAAIGGKTGVDLGTLKNLIGVIRNPKMVLIDTGFLATLPQNEMRSGLAEMYKHGLVADKTYWDKLCNLGELHIEDLNILIYESVLIKNTIVLQDPQEKGRRKVLNYGHTLGHAIESYCLENETRETLLHGEAIAIGMILESYLSHHLNGLSEQELQDITTTLSTIYDPVAFTATEIETIINLMKYDKKNQGGRINFVLLEAIGQPVINQEVPRDLIIKAFEYYKKQA